MLEYKLFKEDKLSGRYITNADILPLIELHNNHVEVEKIGTSVEKRSIFSLKIGTGKKRILAWSQMHGNESTTTKAIFDLLNRLKISDELTEKLLTECTICIVPILNPDGAVYYTRYNANNVDLNRDAQQLSQPESKVLRKLYDDFCPDYCFNLHGQRTIFSAGYSSNSSVMSFLSPAENAQRAVTDTRKIAMELIVSINQAAQEALPAQISRYDDGYNADCVGDAFQALQTPTVLFEAGHYPGDYQREKTREFVFNALVTALSAIVENDLNGDAYQPYFKLPENQKLFFDVVIRNVKDKFKETIDVAIQYEEVLKDEKIEFVPKVVKVGDLTEFFGHKEIDGENNSIVINNKGNITDSLSIIDRITINKVDFMKKISIC